MLKSEVKEWILLYLNLLILYVTKNDYLKIWSNLLLYLFMMKLTGLDVQAYSSYRLHENFTHIFSNSSPCAKKNNNNKYKLAFDVTDSIEMEYYLSLRCFIKKRIKWASLTAIVFNINTLGF